MTLIFPHLLVLSLPTSLPLSLSFPFTQTHIFVPRCFEWTFSTFYYELGYLCFTFFEGFGLQDELTKTDGISREGEKSFTLRTKGKGGVRELRWTPGIRKKKALRLSVRKVEGGSPADLVPDVQHWSEGRGTNYKHLDVKRTSPFQMPRRDRINDIQRGWTTVEHSEALCTLQNCFLCMKYPPLLNIKCFEAVVGAV